MTKQTRVSRSFLFELLQVALGNRDSLSAIPSANEWANLLRDAQKQSIVGILADGLERLPEAQRPPRPILFRWIGLTQMVEKSYALQMQRAKELTELFSAKGYSSTVLKGVGFSQLYDNPAHRQCGDIDLWVDGDRKEVLLWVRASYGVEHVVWHHIDANIFDDVHTEIHFHPGWFYNPFLNIRLQKWFESWKKSQMNPILELGFAHPSLPFNAVYSLVHLYHHFIEEGIGIRHILDYYFILIHLPLGEREEVVRVLENLGLLKLASALMWVLGVICGLKDEYFLTSPNEKEGRFLLDEIVRGGNFGRYRTDYRKRNTIERIVTFLKHYPREVIWIVPWKIWHRFWRMINA